MRILLDESLPRPLAGLLTNHVVSTVRDEGWTSLSNGVLLRQAAATFGGDGHTEALHSHHAKPVAPSARGSS